MDCDGMHHLMTRMAKDGVEDWARELGDWLQCSLCELVALVPKESVLRSPTNGRHLAP